MLKKQDQGAGTPHVTVVIPCYNRADTVAEAVETVLSQDYPSFDVIAVDDNSTDATLDVLSRMDDPRLRVVTNPGPRGPCSTRNHGAALSNSPWIAFQDSDDIWLPGKLMRQMAEVSGTDAVAVYCGMVVKDDATASSPVLRRYPGADITHVSGDIMPSLAFKSFISTQTVIIRRDVFEAVGGFDETFQALVDWELMLRVAQQGNVAFVDDDLVIQRLSGNSITRTPRKRVMAQEMVLAKHADMLAGYKGALAFHHRRLAGGHRIGRQFAQASKHAMAAWRTSGSPRFLAEAAYAALRARFSPGAGKGESS